MIEALIGSSDVETTVKYTMNSGYICENSKTDSCHASTIVKLSNGNLVSAWFGGSGESNDDVRIWYSRYENGAWVEPQQIETTDTVAHWNPVLQNYVLFVRLYYKVGTDTKNWVTKYVDSYNGGKTWTSPTELVPGDTSGGRGPVKNKCLVTKKGLMIAPASTEQGEWKAFFDISKDGGKTWTKTDYVVAKKALGGNVSMIQPTLWEDASGVHAFFRTKSNKIYRADSTDGGLTWGEAYATSLPNNNSGIDCVMTSNGWLWLAYNPISVNGLRNKLMLSVSKDGGQTWEDVTYLEKSANLASEFSYPTIVADGNNLYISYTYKRETIKYAFITFEG